MQVVLPHLIIDAMAHRDVPCRESHAEKGDFRRKRRIKKGGEEGTLEEKKKMRPSFIAYAGIKPNTTRPRVEYLAYESCVRLCVRTQMRHTHAIDNAVREREIEPLDRSRRAKKKKLQYRAQILLRDSKNRPGYFATNLFFFPDLLRTKIKIGDPLTPCVTRCKMSVVQKHEKKNPCALTRKCFKRPTVKARFRQSHRC